MKHVVINFPGTNKVMSEGYTDNGKKVGLWIFYNNSGDIIYRLNYNEGGKLDGTIIAGDTTFYQNYEYDNNEMKSNVGYRTGRKNYSFNVGSNQEILNKTHKDLPAVGEFFLMSLNAKQKSTNSDLTFDLYLPILIKNIVAGDVTVLKDEYTADYWGKFIVCVRVKLVDVENIWRNSSSSEEFNSRFLSFLDIKNRILNDNLISNNNTDNIISIIKNSVPANKINSIRITFGDIKLGNEDGFGWSKTYNIDTFKSCPIIIENSTIYNTSIDPEVDKLRTFPGVNVAAVMRSSSVIKSYQSYDVQTKYIAQYTTGNTNDDDKIVNVFNLCVQNEEGELFSKKLIDYYWYEVYGIVISKDGVKTEFRDRTLPFNMKLTYWGFRVNSEGRDERHYNGVSMKGISYSLLKWLLPVQINKDNTYKLAVRICSKLYKTDWKEFEFNIKNIIISNNNNFLNKYPFNSAIYNRFLDWRKYKDIDLSDPNYRAKVLAMDDSNPSGYEGFIAAPRWVSGSKTLWQPDNTRADYPYIDLPKLIITDNFKRINSEFLNKNWIAYKWPKPEYETINPAEVYPDTRWEIISTDIYIEHISKNVATNRDEDDKLKAPVITTFDINGKISGTCGSKKIICYCKDSDDIYYEKYVCDVIDGVWTVDKALYILPYHLKDATNLKFIAIPIYKEGFGKKVEHEFTLLAGWRKDWKYKVPLHNKLNKNNTNIQDKDDIPLFIWRRLEDHENYHPYKFKDEFKEYCITAPEELSLYRSGRYSLFANHEKVIKSCLDGDDIIYYHGNELLRRNWDTGTLNPTIILNDIHGNRLNVITLKNDSIFSGTTSLNINNHNFKYNFIKYNENGDMRIVSGKSYNGFKIYDDIDNRKD